MTENSAGRSTGLYPTVSEAETLSSYTTRLHSSMRAPYASRDYQW